MLSVSTLVLIDVPLVLVMTTMRSQREHCQLRIHHNMSLSGRVSDQQSAALSHQLGFSLLTADTWQREYSKVKHTRMYYVHCKGQQFLNHDETELVGSVPP